MSNKWQIVDGMKYSLNYGWASKTLHYVYIVATESGGRDFTGVATFEPIWGHGTWNGRRWGVVQ